VRIPFWKYRYLSPYISAVFPKKALHHFTTWEGNYDLHVLEMVQIID